MDLELIQFPFSTYNEKARWALDFKRASPRDKFLLPGPHGGYVKKLTGQTATPVLRADATHIAGSARIIDFLEREFPDPPLYPATDAERRVALDIQARFDEDWGPRSRRAILTVMAGAPGYVARLFGSQHGPIARGLYGAMLPLVRGKIRRGNGINSPADVADGERAIDEMLEFVAETAAATGYLVGDRFTVADLTAASFLAPIADPPGSTMTRPRPVPQSVALWQLSRADHPGTAWTLEMYRRHRSPKAAELAVD